ncbi:aminodeoxychorismate synthase component I [Celerinatantimonas sp. YJH-8]|uniref:aminodeoxychorismate synthase component I n=1 Tax=Celerinatantimonas sp. YJH-8 TaxID=3228714 RepID=UPI0038BFACF6
MIHFQPVKFTAELLMQILGPHRWSQMLHSAPDSNEKFDIYVADPIATLTTYNSDTTIWDGDHYQISQADPFELCQQLRQQFFPESSPSEFPFSGGLVGLWGYDLGRRVEPIPVLNKTRLQTPDMAVGVYDWVIIVDHDDHQQWLVVNHPDAEHYWQYRYRWLQQLSVQPLQPFRLLNTWQTDLPFAAYENRFAQIQNYLRQGDCYQINLTQQFTSQYQGDIRTAYQQLLATNGAPYSAYIQLPQSTILSISPERFIALDGNHIETKPIKGTRPRGTDAITDHNNAEQLRLSPKDRAENVMIVDLLRNDIGRVSKPGTVRVPKLFDIESFPAVHHLVSTITGELRSDLCAEDLLRACFPGGSITGAPKVRAMEIIEQIEPHRRNAYCGSIGYICQSGKMDTNITIRTLVAEQGTLFTWAGGGIVADSDVHEEYQECHDKLGRILPVLQEIL